MTNLEITRPDSRRAALTGLIDYAGLFPPAALGMEEAVAEYRSARASDLGWLVDRFICPVDRLEELLGTLVGSMRAGEVPWSIAVTAGWIDSLTADAGAVRTFTDTTAPAASVDLVEVRVPAEAATEVAAFEAAATEVINAYAAVVVFEIPWRGDIVPAFDGLQRVRVESRRSLAVKIRCGGLEPDLFPPSEAVAQFLLAAAARSLPVKATAGLHHPFRHTDTATGFTHHGFLNLLVAGTLASTGAGTDELTAALDETDAGAFRLDRSGLTWRDHRFDHEALAAARTGLFMGYGSCSFEEPVDDLVGLGVLPL